MSTLAPREAIDILQSKDIYNSNDKFEEIDEEIGKSRLLLATA